MSYPIIINGNPASEEQTAIIMALKFGSQNILVNAFAGTGKTTTLVGASEAFPSSAKILYLVFNKSMEEEARKRFGDNVEIRTVNSFAYRNIVSRGQEVGFYNPYSLSKEFGISYKEASMLQKSFSRYCNSGDLFPPYEYSDQHLVEEMYNRMDRGEMKINHEFYVKKFHLNLANKVPMYNLGEYTLLMIDEYQDTNDVTKAIAELVDAKQRIKVGDFYQGIYGFRGATNAMDNHKGEKFYLTTSYRFGKDIAYSLNLQLRRFRNESNEIKGAGNKKNTHTAAFLSRTNSSLVKTMLKLIDKNYYFKTIREPELIFKLPINIAYLNEDKIDAVTKEFNYLKKVHQTYKSSGYPDGFAEYLIEEGSKNDDIEMVAAANIAKEHSSSKLNSALETAQIYKIDSRPCSYFLGTAHSSKGSEYDIVQLSDDYHDYPSLIAKWCLENDVRPNGTDYVSTFSSNARGGFVKSSVLEEFNLLYVACSRARVDLRINDSIKSLLGNEEKLNKMIHEAYLDLEKKISNKKGGGNDLLKDTPYHKNSQKSASFQKGKLKIDLSQKPF